MKQNSQGENVKINLTLFNLNKYQLKHNFKIGQVKRVRAVYTVNPANQLMWEYPSKTASRKKYPYKTTLSGASFNRQAIGSSYNLQV